MGKYRKKSLLQAEGASHKSYDVAGAQTVRKEMCLFVCFGGEGVVKAVNAG